MHHAGRCAASSAAAIRFCRIVASAWRAVLTQPLRERGSVDKFHRKIGALELWIDREDEIAHDRIVRETVKDRGFAAEKIQNLGIALQIPAGSS